MQVTSLKAQSVNQATLTPEQELITKCFERHNRVVENMADWHLISDMHASLFNKYKNELFLI